jgi:hypothetical protein
LCFVEINPQYILDQNDFFFALYSSILAPGFFVNRMRGPKHVRIQIYLV